MDVSVIIATLEGCDPDQINNPDFFEALLHSTAAAGGFTVLHTYVHPFSPQGVTGTAVLAESHIALHSWPEHGSLFVDMATCSGAEATQRAFEHLCERVKHTNATRSSLTTPTRPNTSHLKRLSNPLTTIKSC